MNVQDILKLIEHDANSFHVAATDALAAFVEILSELTGQISADDLTTLIAIGSVLRRAAGEPLVRPHDAAHPCVVLL